MALEAETTEIKKAVLTSMRGYMPDEKKKAWKSVHNFLLLDALQTELIEKTGMRIELGEGVPSAPIVVVTQERLTNDELNLFQVICDRLDIQQSEIYRTTLLKATKSAINDSNLLIDALYQEIKIIDPVILIFFGRSKLYGLSDFHGIPALRTYALADMLGNSEEVINRKNEAWKGLRAITDQYFATLEGGQE